MKNQIRIFVAVLLVGGAFTGCASSRNKGESPRMPSSTAEMNLSCRTNANCVGAFTAIHGDPMSTMCRTSPMCNAVHYALTVPSLDSDVCRTDANCVAIFYAITENVNQQAIDHLECNSRALCVAVHDALNNPDGERCLTSADCNAFKDAGFTYEVVQRLRLPAGE